MRETVAKQRPMIDLEQFERRLRNTTQGGRGENDPLAELARLSGEREDPYKAVFDKTPPRRAYDEPAPRATGRAAGYDAGRGMGAYDEPPGQIEDDDWRRPEPAADFDYRALRAPRFDERELRRAPPQARPQPAPYDDDFDDGFAQRPAPVHRQSHGGQNAGGANFAGRDFGAQNFGGQDFGGFDEPAPPQPRRRPEPQGDRRAPPQDPYARSAPPARGFEPEDEYPEYPPVFDQDDWRYQDDPRYAAAPEPDEPRSRRPLYIMTAVVLAGVLGIGATYALRGGSGPAHVATIKAHDGPVKIQPENNGAGESDKEDPSILDRTPQASPVAVADGAEQPVDLSQMPERAPRVVGVNGSNAAPARAQAHAAESAGEQMSIASLIEPKKVKTVSVRPDGSVVSSGQAEAAKPAARAAAPKQTAEAKPAAKPEGGGWAAQLAAPSTEADAREIQARFIKKYGALMSDFRPTIHKATAGDKTVYRVRVVGLSKEDATAMCRKVQGAGGACFVAKN